MKTLLECLLRLPISSFNQMLRTFLRACPSPNVTTPYNTNLSKIYKDMLIGLLCQVNRLSPLLNWGGHCISHPGLKGSRFLWRKQVKITGLGFSVIALHCKSNCGYAIYWFIGLTCKIVLLKQRIFIIYNHHIRAKFIYARISKTITTTPNHLIKCMSTALHNV